MTRSAAIRGLRKKAEQLGEHASTAAGKLFKDILWKFVSETGAKCFHCSGDMDRQTFSIEHKIPWLDSADPRSLFFDLSNIAYSHRRCNVQAARRPHKRFATPKEREAAYRPHKKHCPEKRRAYYLRTGK